MSLTKEDKQELASFVQCVLNHWYGLQAAIQNGMGGTRAQTSEKINRMTETITELCSSAQTCKEDISDTLDDLTDSFFDAWFEDGSVDEVASHLWSESRDFLTGNRDKVRAFINSKSKVVVPCPKLPAESDDDDEEDEPMETETSDNTEVVKYGPDEDGWEVPRYRRRNR